MASAETSAPTETNISNNIKSTAAYQYTTKASRSPYDPQTDLECSTDRDATESEPLLEPEEKEKYVSLTSVLHDDNHANAGGLVDVIQGVDRPRGTPAARLDNGGRVRGKVEIAGWIDARVRFVAGNYRKGQPVYQSLNAVLAGED